MIPFIIAIILSLAGVVLCLVTGFFITIAAKDATANSLPPMATCAGAALLCFKIAEWVQ